MSGFHDVRLPLALAIGAAGGPERAVDVARLASGHERRAARWAGSRRRWEIGGVTMRADTAHGLLAFFEARGGRLYAFRFRDPADWKSCAPSLTPSTTDQALGVGDGETAAFQLVKRYGDGEGEWVRAITKPVMDSVLVAVDGVETGAFSVDALTGVVTLDAAPAEGTVVTAGFCFDTAVRFDMERLDFVIEGADALRVVRASVVEAAG